MDNLYEFMKEHGKLSDFCVEHVDVVADWAEQNFKGHDQVRTRFVCAPLYTKIRTFAKAGSGQTHGKPIFKKNQPFWFHP